MNSAILLEMLAMIGKGGGRWIGVEFEGEWIPTVAEQLERLETKEAGFVRAI